MSAPDGNGILKQKTYVDADLNIRRIWKNMKF